MFQIFKSLDAQSETSARRDRWAHRPLQTGAGLEALEDRQVPSPLLASAAAAINFPPGPVMPALAAHCPPIPI